MSNVYVMAARPQMVTDGEVGTALLLQDVPNRIKDARIEAMVASGDYCDTLAAQLEQIASALPLHAAEQYQLQAVIGDLLYLQRNYQLIAKHTAR